jgi:hypothetical protein
MAHAKSRCQSRSQTTSLSQELLTKLLPYTVAAAAAGVATLSCVVPAEAAPVCTTTNIDLGYLGSYMLNPANQKFAPFIAAETFNNISTMSRTAQYVGFFVPNTQNAAVVAKSNLAVPLAPGSVIGTGQQFSVPKSYGLLFTYRPFYRNVSHHKGNFTFNQPQFLGLKFSVGSETHYGWARIVWRIQKGTRSAVLVTGYGYETTPGQPITAGACGAETPEANAASQPTTPRPKEHDSANTEMNPASLLLTRKASSEDNANRRSASLGWLAAGAIGLSRWR